jgi:molybdopterin converting factor small subunit
MAVVYIPTLLREFTGGEACFQLEGDCVADLLNQLEERFPGIRARLLRPNVVIALDGEMATHGEADSVNQDTEVHFVAAISGGCADVEKIGPEYTPVCGVQPNSGTVKNKLER